MEKEEKRMIKTQQKYIVLVEWVKKWKKVFWNFSEVTLSNHFADGDYRNLGWVGLSFHLITTDCWA